MQQYKDILVYCEIEAGKVLENSLELLGEAVRLKGKFCHNPKVIALVMGTNTTKYIDEIQGYGAEQIILFDDIMLEKYRPDYYSEALTNVINKYKPEILLLGATLKGEEIGPTVAKKLDTGMAAHCIELNIVGGDKFIQIVPAFGGKVLGEIICPNSRPQIASIKAGLMDKVEFNKENKAKIENFNSKLFGFGDKIEILEIKEVPKKRKSLNDSDIIIGGGFGIGSKGVWNRLEILAELLGGVTGCTRPVLDEKWVEYEEAMIGTSGGIIKPKVYLNFGISGAAHHTCGIKDSGMIISINNDDNASIFDVSDYFAIADGEETIESLIKSLTV